jgi:drug/metabolite transporter (DMT)-like permease
MSLGLLFLVAFFWGTSNPLMKRVTADEPGEHAKLSSPIAHMISLFKRHEYLVLFISCDPHRWKFIAAYLYDQAGSMLYYYSLGSTDLSIAVPIANGLTFAVAGITEAIVDKRLPTRATIEGSVLILIGVYVCFSSKQ